MSQKYFIIAKGKVQGVGFRALVKRQADAYGLHGYVKNLPDESVEICLQEDNESLVLLFLDRLKSSKTKATIEQFVVSKKITETSFSMFYIEM